jgi:acyl dehydratase
LPNRAPDHVAYFATTPQQALLYRLNGDMNPLHADPQFAQRVGFERPILHGLATYAAAVWVVLRHCCDARAERLRGFRASFSAPMYPGETLRFELWREAGRVAIRAFSEPREVKVLDLGWAEVEYNG